MRRLWRNTCKFYINDKNSNYDLKPGIMCTEGFHGRLSIDTLDWYPWLALDQHSIDTLVDTLPTLHRHQLLFSVDSQSWLIFHQCLRVGRHSADFGPTVYQVSTKNQSGCRSRCRSRLLIKGIDRHSTPDAYSTHDPKPVQFEPS